MHAVDTNVLVRLLTADEPEQTRRAAALFQREDIFIAKTVLLETAWVLQSVYDLKAPAILDALRKLAGLANVEIEDAQAVWLALGACEKGMDLADALHVASSRGADKFATFDARVVKSAPKDDLPLAVLL